MATRPAAGSRRPADEAPPLGALVLCGGSSRRMGRSKAWLPFEGQPLLEHVVRRLAPVAHPVIVVAAPEQALPALPPEVAVARDPVEGLGPLQGMAVGLEQLAFTVEVAFVTSTDAPFVEPAFVRRLLAAWSEPEDAVVPHVGGWDHPLCAVYATRVHPRAQALVQAGQLAALGLLDHLRTCRLDEQALLADPGVQAADPELRSVHSLNTMDEYRAALRR